MKFANYTKATGTVTSVAQGKLVDANANFLGGGGLPVVQVGDVVEREGGPLARARVVQVLSGTELVLSEHIFTAVGQRYRIRAGFVLVSGTTTSHQSGKLIDANADFTGAGVRPGFLVYANGEVASVLSVDSATQLSLSWPLITGSGQRYFVYPGEFVFAESLEIARRETWRVLGADSTPVTLSQAGVVKSLPFFSHPMGLEVRVLRALVEVTASQSGGSVALRVDGEALATAAVPPGTTILVLEAALDLSPGKHTADLYATPPSNANLSIGLTEFLAKEVI